MVAKAIELFEASNNVWIIPLFLVFKVLNLLNYRECTKSGIVFKKTLIIRLILGE